MNYSSAKCLFIIGICIAALCSSLSAKTAVGTHGNLSVSGNRIVNEEGTAVSFAGNSFFWSNNGWGGEDFYNTDVVNYLQEEWNSTIIRASIGVEESGGYIDDPSNNLAKAKMLIDAAIEQGMYIIVDWHSHNAEDYETEAIAFFTEIATVYGDTPNVLYEPYNEPDRSPSTSIWSGIKPYLETMVETIRAIDPDNIIILGSPTWSQDVDVASNDPVTGYDNIAYTVHFYAGTHMGSLRNKVTTALNNGIAVIATEYGTVNADGNGGVSVASSDAWITFLRDNQITHLNWAVNNKDEGASVFKPSASSTGTWTDDDLTASGLYVKEVVKGWDTVDYEGDEFDPLVDWLEEQSYAADVDLLSDPDNNGLSILLEYALGVDLQNPSAPPAIAFSNESSESYSINIPAMIEKLSYKVYSTQDFESWMLVDETNGTGDLFSIELPQNTTRSFYKLTVSQDL